MGEQSLPIIIVIPGLLLLAFFLYLWMSGKKYKDFLEPLSHEEFPFCGFYGVGLRLLEITKHNYGSNAERERQKKLGLVYGEKYAEYYLRVNAAQRVTISYLFLLLGFFIAMAAKDNLLLFVFAAFAAFMYYYVGTLPQEKLNKKTEVLLSDFAEVVSKLALLTNAGMTLREAWDKVGETGDTEFYREMQITTDQINNGTSEIDAYGAFGTRCIAPEIKKFTSTIIQGQMKGNRELVEMIKQQSREVWSNRQHRVRQQGEKAASKLLIPIAIMFVGILIIIIIPIFANLFG
ncbi:MAG: type II secretion system F family protein [Lachnospiraceae bacterium]|nr:type II secretion system F family protein [Lachnospiraceae bacterium]